MSDMCGMLDRFETKKGAISAQLANSKSESAVRTEPSRMKGLLLPSGCRHESDKRPMSGWTSNPEMGPASQASERRCGERPSSVRCGVARLICAE